MAHVKKKLALNGYLVLLVTVLGREGKLVMLVMEQDRIKSIGQNNNRIRFVLITEEYVQVVNVSTGEFEGNVTVNL